MHIVGQFITVNEGVHLQHYIYSVSSSENFWVHLFCVFLFLGAPVSQRVIYVLHMEVRLGSELGEIEKIKILKRKRCGR